MIKDLLDNLELLECALVDTDNAYLAGYDIAKFHGVVRRVLDTVSNLCDGLDRDDAKTLVSHVQSTFSTSGDMRSRYCKQLVRECLDIAALLRSSFEIEHPIDPIIISRHISALKCAEVSSRGCNQKSLISTDDRQMRLFQQRRILVVDDDFVSRRITATFLAKYGDCDVATNGCEGFLSYLMSIEEKHPYDLIVVDIIMPRIDGWRLLTHLQSANVSAREEGLLAPTIIMTSTQSAPNDVLSSFRSGCHGYLVKPLDPKTLVQLLSKLNFCSSSEPDV